MKLTQNKKIALLELENVTGKQNNFTSKCASIIISILCDLQADNITLKRQIETLEKEAI